MTPTPPEISSAKNSRGHPQKRVKKSDRSISSGHATISILDDEFSKLEKLDLVKENFKKMIFSGYEKKISNMDFSKIKDKGLLRMRIKDILEPLIFLNNCLRGKRDSHKLEKVLDKMFGTPFTASMVVAHLDANDRVEFKNLCQYVRYLARDFTRAGIFSSGFTFDPEWDFPDNPVMNNCEFWYMKGYDTKQDIEEFVMGEYRKYNKYYGKKKPKEEKKEEIPEEKEDKEQSEFEVKPDMIRRRRMGAHRIQEILGRDKDE